MEIKKKFTADAWVAGKELKARIPSSSPQVWQVKYYKYYCRCHENGSFSVHSFNEHSLSHYTQVAEGTVIRKHDFLNCIKCIYRYSTKGGNRVCTQNIGKQINDKA